MFHPVFFLFSFRQLQCILEDPDNPPPPTSPSAYSTSVAEGAIGRIEEEDGVPLMYNEKTGKKMTPAQGRSRRSKRTIHNNQHKKSLIDGGRGRFP